MRRLLTSILLATLLPLGAACGGESDWRKVDGNVAAEAPQVVACDAVQSGACLYTDVGCEPGLLSFDVEITTSTGCHGAFHITCAGGCISSVIPK